MWRKEAPRSQIQTVAGVFQMSGGVNPLHNHPPSTKNPVCGWLGQNWTDIEQFRPHFSSEISALVSFTLLSSWLNLPFLNEKDKTHLTSSLPVQKSTTSPGCHSTDVHPSFWHKWLTESPSISPDHSWITAITGILWGQKAHEPRSRFLQDDAGRLTTVVWWSAFSPHSKETQVQIPAGSFLCVCMFFLYMQSFSMFTLTSSYTQKSTDTT